MFGFLNKKKSKNLIIDFSNIGTDMHCHMLPGIDDGAKTMEESIAMVNWFLALGYKKVYCTPHIMGDLYKNTPEGINQKLGQLQFELQKQNIQFEVNAAAEYYLDEWFGEKLNSMGLLTFGDNYLLFEISYLNENPTLKKTIFDLKLSGYQPVLAHPERYLFYHTNYKAFDELVSMGVFLQLNLLSLTGYYGKSVKKAAEYLVTHKLVHFAGTDLHHQKHFEALQAGLKSGVFQSLLQQKLLNSTL